MLKRPCKRASSLAASLLATASLNLTPETFPAFNPKCLAQNFRFSSSSSLWLNRKIFPLGSKIFGASFKSCQVYCFSSSLQSLKAGISALTCLVCHPFYFITARYSLKIDGTSKRFFSKNKFLSGKGSTATYFLLGNFL